MPGCGHVLLVLQERLPDARKIHRRAAGVDAVVSAVNEADRFHYIAKLRGGSTSSLPSTGP